MLRAAVVVVVVGLCAANWEQYKAAHGKSYSKEEDEHRRAIFEANVKRISEHNLRYDLSLTSYRMGLNQFTDFTSEELEAYRGLKFDASKRQNRSNIFDHSRIHGDQPVAIDWRTMGLVTPVKDQGQCGSCWAFSATGALEGQNFIKLGKLIPLSEQNLVDCSADEGNGGCNGGQMDQAFEYIRKNGGIDTEQSYPYAAKEGQCQFNVNSVGAQCSGFVDIQSGNEDALKTAVITIGPISVAIDASHDSFRHYKDGIYDEPQCSSTGLDHGVLVVGYGTEFGKDFWIVKNSWNTVWGDQGYIKMSRNKKNQCGIATAASFPKV